VYIPVISRRNTRRTPEDIPAAKRPVDKAAIENRRANLVKILLTLKLRTMQILKEKTNTCINFSLGLTLRTFQKSAYPRKISARVAVMVLMLNDMC